MVPCRDQLKLAIQEVFVTLNQQLRQVISLCADSPLGDDGGYERLPDHFVLAPSENCFGVLAPAGNQPLCVDADYGTERGVEHGVGAHLRFDQLAHGMVKQYSNRN